MASQRPNDKLPATIPVNKPVSTNSELVDAVRNWVHFDNLAESLNKQVTNARNLRSEYEAKVIQHLEKANMKHSTIKISGATLQCATRTKQSDLGWTMLTDHLHDYFKSRGRVDETNDILNYLQKARDVKTIDYLKKTTV